MGCNYYLLRKRDYIDDIETPVTLGCSEETTLMHLNNGYVFDNTYYPDLDTLNKHFYQKIHIGKSSYGWHFLLCIYPEYGINNLSDWIELFESNTIINECDEVITAAELLDTICNRRAADWDSFSSLEAYEAACLETEIAFMKQYAADQFLPYPTSYEQMLYRNHAERGLNGLWAHQADEYTRHTDGTYDYIISGNDVEKCIIFS